MRSLFQKNRSFKKIIRSVNNDFFLSSFEKIVRSVKKLCYLKSLFQLVVCSVKNHRFSKSFGEIVSLVKNDSFFKCVQSILNSFLQVRSQKFRPFTKTLHIFSRNSGPVK